MGGMSFYPTFWSHFVTVYQAPAATRQQQRREKAMQERDNYWARLDSGSRGGFTKCGS